MACAKLHNYVIDCQLMEKEAEDDDEVMDDDDSDEVHCTQLDGAPLGLQYLPTLPDEEFERVPKISMTRIAIIEEIRRQNYRRPLHNVTRNLGIRDKDSNSYIVPKDTEGNDIEVEFFHPS
mmetsp:Transcript_3211/g.5257  ORF Transcript_3211/g.5257 Transcript_3211/m.5257 type:complete len:121 (-) Transcript_3211:101-463(-)